MPHALAHDACTGSPSQGFRNLSQAFVWFIAAFPAILAMAGAVRLGNIMCKMQLAHACLGQGCLLTEPLDSSYLDFALLTMLSLSRHCESNFEVFRFVQRLSVQRFRPVGFVVQELHELHDSRFWICAFFFDVLIHFLLWGLPTCWQCFGRWAPAWWTSSQPCWHWQVPHGRSSKQSKRFEHWRRSWKHWRQSTGILKIKKNECKRDVATCGRDIHLFLQGIDQKAVLKFAQDFTNPVQTSRTSQDYILYAIWSIRFKTFDRYGWI